MPPIVIIAVIALGAFVLLANRTLMGQWFRSRSWKATSASIIENRDEVIWSYTSASESQARMEQAHAKSYSYRFEVGERAYCTNRLGFGGESITHARFRIGQKVTVYYDPENPQNAVLVRDFPFGASFGLMLIGGGALCLVLRVVMT